MGDGGVAYMHLQHSNIMDRFTTPNSPTLTTSNANSASSTAPTAVSVANSTANNATCNEKNCNGSSNNNNISVSSNNGNGSSNVKSKSNGVNSKPKRIVKKIIKVKKLVSGKKVVVERTEVKSEKKLVENGTTSSVGIVRKNKVESKAVEVKEENKADNTKDEVEEGELGTLKWPPPRVEVENGEFVPLEKTRRSEIEKGEVVGEKWRKGEVEKGEIVAGSKWRKGEVGRDEIEKGEFIPDRWHVKDDYNYGKARGRYDSFRERTPPSGRYSADEIYRRKELSRSVSSQQNKSLARWEFAQEKNVRLSSKIVDDGVYKGEYDNGKSYGRDYTSSGNRLKRHGADSDGSERRHHGDYIGSKSRRVSDDTTRSVNPEHYSHHSVDRFHRNSSSSRVLSLEKYSLRHHETTLSSKVVYDRHPQSPGYSERSPHDRARFYDYRDRSPVHRDRSPYSREKSPYGRDRSPYGRERSPYGRERSPHGRERTPYGRERSPYGRERTPYVRERTPYGREKSPYAREKSPYGRERTPYGGERTPYGREKSPYGRERSPYVRDKSPYGRERSPYGREKSPYVCDRSPYGRERSPYGRGHHYDHRNRSPNYSERSPYDRARYHDRRDRTPSYLEKSPLDRGRLNNHGEGSRKGGTNEKHGPEHGNKVQNDKLGHKETAEKDSQVSTKESPDKSVVDDVTPSNEKIADSGTHKEGQSQSPSKDIKESPHAIEPPVEDLQSMEEDMDICDTPPHVAAPVVADTVPGKWYYLDYFGVERGPSKLSDLKMLVSEGFLAEDHMVKHLDSDRWVTAENAVSPLVTVNFQTVVSESIAQLVTPPEAPGNVLEDSGDIGPSVVPSREESPAMLDSMPLKDLHIDERVGALLDGFTVIPCREVETIGEILRTTFKNVQLEGWGKSEDDGEELGQTSDELLKSSDIKAKEDEGSISLLGDADHEFASFVGTADWFSDRWSCKGGDWKRNDETVQERFSRRKLVLNDGFPLCQMPKAGSEDPRWHRKDDLYYPSQSRRLDLPPWAFSCSDERNELGVVGRATVNKPPITKAAKGTMLPVVRINACVVKDHGSFVSEPRMKVRGKDRYLSRSARAQSATGEGKRSTMESDSQFRALHGQESGDSWRSGALINIPKNRLCTADDLQLQFGEWYYLDGTGHERGPLSFSDLQVLAAQGIIQKHSSVYRKFDRVWVPISSILEATEVTLGTDKDSVVSSGNSSVTLSKSQNAAINGRSKNSSSFHSSHPQFIGYTRGKLHELVMKSFKSREFAAAINEVLDPWIIVKQPKKESDKHIYRRSETDARGGKRSRMLVDDSDEDYEMEEDIQKDEIPFEELCSGANFCDIQGTTSESEVGNWGLLDGHMLARVFHFLRSDIKSLALASLTCKHWRSAVSFYKAISRQIDFSSIGPKCTDSIIWSVMDGYNKEKVTSMVLLGCSNISSAVLDEILRSFPCLSSVDIRGCSQLVDLPIQFPNISWVKRCLPGVRSSEESSSRIRTLKQLSEKTIMSFKPTALGGDFDLKEYFDSVNKRDSDNQFRGSLYRRSKLLDARKSSSIISRDARMKRWAMKKSASGYKRMEGFLASGLKDIMKENIFDFFVPKVAEIEDRMKSGYYLGHGLKSVKEDISRMCRDAIKFKNRGGGDVNHITTLFLKLASRLEESSKFSYERDELMKSWKDDLSAELGSASMKYKKKQVNERKFMNRSNGVTYSNGGFDYGEYASDRDIRKRLSKLNRKSMDSGSETSDEFDKSSEYGKSNGESTASDTESDLDFQSESRVQESKDGYFTADESYDGMGDEREWGARMTKASLVPPVTRKYEVIHHYVIVADEDDVKRKMSVSLPDNYAEKLETQKNGTEELELPEVKDFKPRKHLGDEVIEQEVYGIDPYTHNLLLDSMPDEVDMSAEEKHLFIEDVILRTLNKQVRDFTGSGNTPMTYPLQHVIEQIEQDADEDGNVRIIKLCRGILKAIDSRPDDNYVAYRKGLGVVCNKEGGFGDEDFVVEFLGEVYPVWKWFEKQDGIRSLQKDSKEPAPEFYNIYLERPKGDADGYDLVVVDAMHKANYASRICHSCKPNCEAKVTAVDGQYQIGIYAVREIQYGEEVTFDYNSVTESKEEYEASVCLCGSQVCRGSYLNLTGEGAFQKIMKEWHGMLDRCSLMLEACDLNCVSEDDYLDLGRAGLGSCLLGGLPDWVVAYSARLVRFINLERAKLPEEILRHNIEEKRKYFLEANLETERQVAEIEAEGVHNQRLQNLALTLDKVRYVMRCVFGDPKKAPPPLEKLSLEETVSFLWKGEGSLVEELLQCMAPHVEEIVLNDLKSKIHAHDPSDSHNVRKELQKSLLWLRDAIRCLPCTHKCRHDAAADLIHVYAYTKYFFRIREYSAFTSPPLFISPLDLGPKYADKVGADGHEYQKTYGENYCLGQLIFWHLQTNANPDCNLARASRGCLSLPDIGSFYAKAQKSSQQRIYGPKTVKTMLERMEKFPQKPWPKDQIWSFKSSPNILGTPMFDSVIDNTTSLDKEMLHWLKHKQ